MIVLRGKVWNICCYDKWCNIKCRILFCICHFQQRSHSNGIFFLLQDWPDRKAGISIHQTPLLQFSSSCQTSRMKNPPLTKVRLMNHCIVYAINYVGCMFNCPCSSTVPSVSAVIHERILKQRWFPRTIPPDNTTNFTRLNVKWHILLALKNSSERGARWNHLNSAFTELTFRNRGAWDIFPAVRRECISCRDCWHGWRCFYWS